ncbi:MAG TPA: hypothetical protein VGO11_19995 [Chthoniobacteraceae bacterium]|nr:hypothetical protein [Chthoniobacteraceae bacterium]
MPFNPLLPANGSPDSSAEMRSQLTGLFDLIQSIPVGPQGPPGTNGNDGGTGPQEIPGPPGNDGAPGAAGGQGPEGPQGPPGNDGSAGAPGPAGPQGPAPDTSAFAPRPVSVVPLSLVVSEPPSQADVQAIVTKLNELIAALQAV